MDYSIEVFNDFTAELEYNWRELEKKSNHFFFQTYCWQEHWYKTVGVHNKRLTPYIILVKSFNGPLLIAPLAVERVFFLKIIKFLGGGLSDYNNFLIDSDIATDANILFEFWNSVVKKFSNFDLIHLERIPSLVNFTVNNCTFLEPLKLQMLANYSKISSGGLIESGISKKLLSDNSRMKRRLNEQGLLKFEVLNQDFEKSIQEILYYKEKQYLKSGARNILNDEKVKNFFYALVNIPNVHISILKLNDEFLAGHIGFIYNQRFYYLLPVNGDEKWKKYSPGRLLLQYLYEFSFANNLECYDFTTGSEDYKRHWCNGSFNINYYLKLNSFRGVPYLLVLRIIIYIKQKEKLISFVRLFNKIFRIK